MAVGAPQANTSAETARWRRILIPLLALIVVAAGAGIAVIVSKRDDAQAINVESPSIWVTNDGRQYGRVNTSILELDTTRAISNTAFSQAGLLQSGDDVLLATAEKSVVITPAAPPEIDESVTTGTIPSGASEPVVSGDFVALLNAEGIASGGTVAGLIAGEEPHAINVQEGVDGDSAPERFVAVSVTEGGLLYALGTSGQLVSYDITKNEELSRTNVVATEVSSDTIGSMYSLSVFGSHWALLRTSVSDESGALWIDGTAVNATLSNDTVLARPSSIDTLAVATVGGLLTFDGAGAQVGASIPASGAPAVPVVDSRGCVQAAWVSSLADGGVQVSSCGQPVTTLTEDANVGNKDVVTFRKNRGSLVLNNTRTGAVWVLVNNQWRIVASSLNHWNEDDTSKSESEETTDTPPQVNVCPIPATGEGAEFGARPGAVTRIPVLIEARDQNPGDLLRIVPGSLRWDKEKFPGWDFNVVDEGQSVALSTDPTATGSITLTFKITDGGVNCEVAAQSKITLYPGTVNGAPQQRGLTLSAADRTVSAGANLKVDLLRSWVDPEGDPLTLIADPASEGTLIADPSGTAVYRPAYGQTATTVTVNYQVVDPTGLSTVGRTSFFIDPQALPKAESFAQTVVNGVPSTVDLGKRISQVVGPLTIALKTTQGDPIVASILPNGTSMSLTATKLGRYQVGYTATGTNGQSAGTIWIEVIAPETATVSTAPIRVFVPAGQDVTIDPLSATFNPAGRALAVTDVTTTMTSDVLGASMDVGIVNGAALRVAVTAPGLSDDVSSSGQMIGTFNYSLRANGDPVSGFGTVYAMPEQPATTPIAVNDSAIVRAGATVDIPVLENDIAPAGSALVLDPRVREDGDLSRGLAFPSGSVLRYQAPSTPGVYEMRYRVYPRGNPAQSADASVFITVRGSEGQSAPLPQSLSGRVPALNSVDLDIPRFGQDPDGDEVFAVSVEQPSRGGLAQIIDNGSRIRVTSTEAVGGVIRFSYTVSDGVNEATGTADVEVSEQRASPIAFHDYLYGGVGDTVTVNPVLNDSIPQGQTAKMVSVAQLKPVNGADGVPRFEPVEMALPPDGKPLELTVVEGTTYYEYRIETSTSNGNGEAPRLAGSAAARIVVRSSSSAVPVFPVVADSVVSPLQIKDDSFAVDVVTDRVAWVGEPLSAALVSAKDGAAINGNTVTGRVTNTNQIIAFSLTAPQTTAGGEPIVTYGFVHVPRVAFLRPELIDPAKIYTVEEGEALRIPLLGEIAAPNGKTPAVVSAVSDGLRQHGRCVVENSTTVRYVSGQGTEPRDGCAVSVKWADDGDDVAPVILRLGIRVLLANPPPVMASGVATVEVFPAATSAPFPLERITQWDRHTAADIAQLRYSCDFVNSSISVSCASGSVVVTADKLAMQGTTENIQVRVVGGPGFPFESEIGATVSVKVLVPPVRQIDVKDIVRTLNEGDQLEPIDVGAEIAGQMPYGWTGTVSNCGVTSGGTSCAARGNLVTIDVTPGLPGGEFIFRYAWVDNPSNPKPNHGEGVIRVIYNAKPRVPVIVTTTSGTSSVSIDVRESENGVNVPALTRLEVQAHPVKSGSPSLKSQQCAAPGCTVTFTGMLPNHKYDFVAVATNAAGTTESPGVRTWAYEPIASAQVEWRPESVDEFTLFLRGDAITARYIVEYLGKSQTVVANGATEVSARFAGLTPGSPADVKVTAATDMEPPKGGAAMQSDVTQVTVTTVSKPSIRLAEPKTENGSVTATAKISVDGPNARVLVGWALQSQECKVTTAPQDVGVAATVTFPASTPGLDQYRDNKVKVCAESYFSGSAPGLRSAPTTMFGRAKEDTSVFPFEDPPSVDRTYSITPDTMQVSVPEKFTVKGVALTVVPVKAEPTKSAPVVTIKLCAGSGTQTCGSKTYDLPPAVGSATYIPKLESYSFSADWDNCIYDPHAADRPGGVSLSSTLTFRAPTLTDKYGGGTLVAGEDYTWQLSAPGTSPAISFSQNSTDLTWTPASAFSNKNVELRVKFRGDLNGLQDLTKTQSLTCAEAPPPGSPDPGDSGGTTP